MNKISAQEFCPLLTVNALAHLLGWRGARGRRVPAALGRGCQTPMEMDNQKNSLLSQNQPFFTSFVHRDSGSRLRVHRGWGRENIKGLGIFALSKKSGF